VPHRRGGVGAARRPDGAGHRPRTRPAPARAANATAAGRARALNPLRSRSGGQASTACAVRSDCRIVRSALRCLPVRADVRVVRPRDGLNAGDDASAAAESWDAKAILAWTVIGTACGVLMSSGANVHPNPGSSLLALAGFATGAVVGIRGLVAVAVGAGAFILAAEVGQIVAGTGARTIESGVLILPLLAIVFAVLVSAWLLPGAALRWLVRRVRAPNTSRVG
jgi:hypothetical protein